MLGFRMDGDPSAEILGKSSFHDVSARPIDIIDTWGPARIVSKTHDQEPDGVLGVEIGGGLLVKT